LIKSTPAETAKGEVHSTLTDRTVSGAVEVVPGIKSALVRVMVQELELSSADRDN